MKKFKRFSLRNSYSSICFEILLILFTLTSCSEGRKSAETKEKSQQKQLALIENEIKREVEDSLKKMQKEREEIKKLPELIQKIQGDWSCIEIWHEDYMTEGAPIETSYLEPQGNLRITEDSVWVFDYPCMYIFSSKIELQERHYSFFNYPLDPFYLRTKIKLKGTDLILTKQSINSKYISRFRRDTFETNRINQLIKDSINLECLKGKWNLITTYDPGYDGTDGIYHFPFNLPYKLDYTSDSTLLNCISDKRFIDIKINGKSKKFYIASLSLATGQFWVLPYKWWKADDDMSYNIRYKLKGHKYFEVIVR